MKKLLCLLSIALLLFSFTGCTNDGIDETYENSDPNNLEEDLYEDEMGDPELGISFENNNIMYYYNV